MNLFSKPMELARYFCAGRAEGESDFAHYALSIDLYTHFTSPIRRYPDVVVHRLLSAALTGDSLSHWTPDDLEKIATHCNERKQVGEKRQSAQFRPRFAPD